MLENKTQPLISVLITTYNTGQYIKQSINSVLNQSFQQFQIIIVDDGSTDNTEEVVKNIYSEKIYYYKIPHSGRSKALNYGLLLCKADWVAILDADDLWHPNKLQMQVPFLNGTNILLATNAAYFAGNKFLFVIDAPRSQVDLIKLLSLHGLIHSSVIYNKNYILLKGGYNEELYVGVDYDLLLRIMNEVKYIPIREYLTFIRKRKNSLSKKNSKFTHTEIYRMQTYYYNTFYEYFNCCNKFDEYRFRGYREIIWGNPRIAKIYWAKIPLSKYNIKMIIFYILSLFPRCFINYLFDSNMRQLAETKFNLLLHNKKYLSIENIFINDIIKKL